MSSSYAQRLKAGAFRGDCDLANQPDPPHVVEERIAELVRLWKASKHVVVHTGAGISTSCGIPDFRGEDGVWTREMKGEGPPQGVAFGDARPSFTHMALAALVRAGFVHYIVSQNVDGLHLRSGVPRDQLSELHGNLFMEHCEECDSEFFGDVELTTVGFKPTGRKCHFCGGILRDQILDWDDKLPEYDHTLAEQHSKRAQLSVCLGTSLQMQPAMNFPVMSTLRYSKKARGSMVICNLAATPQDELATLVVRHDCDDLMRRVCKALAVDVPTYQGFSGPRAFKEVCLPHKRQRRQNRLAREARAAKRQKRGGGGGGGGDGGGGLDAGGPVACATVGCRFFGVPEQAGLCSRHFRLKRAVSAQ